MVYFLKSNLDERLWSVWTCVSLFVSGLWSNTTPGPDLINLFLIYLTPSYQTLLNLMNNFPVLCSVSKTSAFKLWGTENDAQEPSIRVCDASVCKFACFPASITHLWAIGFLCVCTGGACLCAAWAPASIIYLSRICTCTCLCLYLCGCKSVCIKGCANTCVHK